MTEPYDPLQEADNRLYELEWATRRMLQALDGYWQHCDGFYPKKNGPAWPRGHWQHCDGFCQKKGGPEWPRGRYKTEDWWNRYEKYRKIVESCLAP